MRSFRLTFRRKKRRKRVASGSLLVCMATAAVGLAVLIVWLDKVTGP